MRHRRATWVRGNAPRASVQLSTMPIRLWAADLFHQPDGPTRRSTHVPHTGGFDQ